MAQLKPYIIETKDFLFTYHGGGYNPDHIKTLKRSNITTNSRASRKRLAIYLDTVQRFSPTYLLSIKFPVYTDFEKAYTLLKSFTRKLSREDSHNKDLPPLFVWKKMIINNCIVFEILTNIKPPYIYDTFKYYLNYFWRNSDKNIIFDMMKISKDIEHAIKYHFCIFKLFKSDITVKGKWWGVINKQYYKCKEVSKTETSITKVRIKEVELADSKVSNNFYQK